jgi:ribosomal-protein-alanine N-acetyltransferase
MIRRDLPQILAIERRSFEFPWTADDFQFSTRGVRAIRMVCEVGDTILGYSVYELLDGKLDLLNFAVHPKFRRRGFGSQMILRLITPLPTARRRDVRIWIRERNLPAQLFLRHHGFVCRAVRRGWYEETDEDALGFVWSQDFPQRFSPVNRFAHLSKGSGARG